MALNGTKLVKERRIAGVAVSAEVVGEFIKGALYGHRVDGLPDDAQLYQVFWDQQRASFMFHFVSKHFDAVPEGASPGVLAASISTIYPEDITLWQKIKHLLHIR